MAGLKPKDFPGLVGKKIKISTLHEKITESIKSRKDLPVGVTNYLIKLVDYCNNSSDSKKSKLNELYRKVDASHKSGIQKDFSELLGPIILFENKDKVKQLGLTISAQSTALIPTAGNYPLVDFMIYTNTNEDQYSVKTLQKTTNTLKAGDILNTVSESVKKKYAEETEILNIINNNDAKLGPIILLAKVSPKISEFNKSSKMYKKFVAKPNISNDDISENPADWYALFEPIVDAYYSNGKNTFNRAWKRKYYYDALTVLAQYTVAEVTKNMNWNPFVDDVQKKVTYFKFGLNNDGTYSYDVINGLSERKPDAKFRLRAKSRLKEGAESSRSGQDKLGIQP